jgi:drug/metabolite transporter (DMT)-like permease
MVIWGGTWTSAKIIAGTAPQEVLIFWRFFVTFISFIPVVIFFRRSLALNRRAFLQVLLGAIFIVAYNKFFFLGLKFGFAGAAAVLVTTLNPTFTFLFTIIFFSQKIIYRTAIGLCLGFISGLILLKIWHISLNALFQSGNLFFIICSISWASLTITSDHSRENISPLIFSFYVYGLAALLDFFLALPYHLFEALKFDHIFWMNILYLSVFATTFATTIYFIASTRLGSQRASSFIFIVPVSAVIISWILLGEIPRTFTIIGGIVAIIAVYLINSRKEELKPSLPDPPE